MPGSRHSSPSTRRTVGGATRGPTSKRTSGRWRRSPWSGLSTGSAGGPRAAPRGEKSVGPRVPRGGLAGEVGDVGGVVFESSIERLDELGRRGYFTFAAGLAAVLDRIVTSFGEEDLEMLGENIVLLLQTVQGMDPPG